MLLDILAGFVRTGAKPTPGEILSRAKERDTATFDKWAAQTVSRKLKAYGIAVPKKSHGERRYRDVTPEVLRRVQLHYGIDLDTGDALPHPYPLASPPIAPQRHPSDAAGDCGRRG